MRPLFLVLVILLCYGIVGHFDYVDALATEQERLGKTHSSP